MMPSIPTYWVLGATGYIGHQIINELQQKNTRIVTLIHKTLASPNFENCINIVSSLNHLEKSWLKKFPPTTIFHLARLGGSSPKARQKAAKKGAKANNRLLAILKELGMSPKIIYVSGSLMYGNHSNRVDENCRLAPIAFAREYYFAEKPLILEMELPIRLMRPGWILGPDSWFKVFFYNYYKRHGTIPYYNNGEQLMSIISLPDCAGTIVHSAQQIEKSENQNIFLTEPITQQDFAELVANQLNAKTTQVGLKEMQKTMDVHQIEALTSSCPLGTLNKDYLNSYVPYHKNIINSITYALELLERK